MPPPRIALLVIALQIQNPSPIVRNLATFMQQGPRNLPESSKASRTILLVKCGGARPNLMVGSYIPRHDPPTGYGLQWASRPHQRQSRRMQTEVAEKDRRRAEHSQLCNVKLCLSDRQSSVIMKKLICFAPSLEFPSGKPSQKIEWRRFMVGIPTSQDISRHAFCKFLQNRPGTSTGKVVSVY